MILQRQQCWVHTMNQQLRSLLHLSHTAILPLGTLCRRPEVARQVYLRCRKEHRLHRQLERLHRQPYHRVQPLLNQFPHLRGRMKLNNLGPRCWVRILQSQWTLRHRLNLLDMWSKPRTRVVVAIRLIEDRRFLVRRERLLHCRGHRLRVVSLHLQPSGPHRPPSNHHLNPTDVQVKLAKSIQSLRRRRVRHLLSVGNPLLLQLKLGPAERHRQSSPRNPVFSTPTVRTAVLAALADVRQCLLLAALNSHHQR